MSYVVVISFVFLAISTTVLASRRSEYSHVRHTISELGERGAVDEKLVAYGVFLPIGISMSLVAFFVQSNEPAAMLAAALAVGYGGSALFPIDAGAPPIGSWRNGVHSLAGAVQYLGAIGAFEQYGRDFGFPYTMAKFVIFAFLVTIYVPYIKEIRGLFQRIVEVGLFLGLVFLTQNGHA